MGRKRRIEMLVGNAPPTPLFYSQKIDTPVPQSEED